MAKILSQAEAARLKKRNAALAYYYLLVGEGTKKTVASIHAAESAEISVSTFNRWLKKEGTRNEH